MVQKEIALPTRKQCEQLWEQYHTPVHIRRHMQQVARVAVFLAERLVEVGEDVNVQLCERAALLHDLVRVTEWEKLAFDYFDEGPSEEDIALWRKQRQQWPSSIPHAQVNKEILQEQYPEVAQIIALHSLGSVYDVKTWEEKIVHYADRRVAHDKIVSIQERLDEAFKRYSQTNKMPLEQDTEIVRATYALEEEIFRKLDITPNILRSI